MKKGRRTLKEDKFFLFLFKKIQRKQNFSLNYEDLEKKELYYLL